MLKPPTKVERPRFSIIIPIKGINEYLKTNVLHILDQSYSSWELIIVPNEVNKNIWKDHPQIRLVASGKLAPGRKRDIGANISNGQYLVFLDDDSFPDKNYLNIALKYLENCAEYKAFGGPGVTPDSNGLWQQASGGFFMSKFGGGFPERYLPLGKARPVSEWPSVNLIVEKTAFLKVGGFNTDLWPGEDSLFCTKFTHDHGFGLLYVPELTVWHHRRGGFLSHLRQVWQYGVNRGALFRDWKYSPKYLIPTIFLFFVFISPAVLVAEQGGTVFILVGWIAYLLACMGVFIEVQKYKNSLIAALTVLYTFPSHLIFGLGFIQGLVTKRAPNVLR